MLINAAMRLLRSAREENLVVRFGGDEFAILARQLAGSEDATNIAVRIIGEFGQPVVTGSIRHNIGVGIGVALIPQDGRDATEILRKADIALYRAKAEPQSASRFFDAEMDARIRERDLMERDLPTAIASGAVQPYYQPVVSLATEQVVGFEAVEQPLQAEILQKHGCELAQGYLYSPPMPAAETTNFIARHTAETALSLAENAQAKDYEQGLSAAPSAAALHLIVINVAANGRHYL